MPSRSRKHHRPRRRRKNTVLVFLLSGALCVAGAFFAGYHFTQQKLRSSKAAPPPESSVDPQAWDQALALIDGAASARFERRYGDALESVRRAHRIGVHSAVLDISSAQIYFDQGDFASLRSSATLAARRQQYRAEANTLLGLDRWLNRGGADFEITTATEEADARFSDAAEADHFSGAVYFFWSEAVRGKGQLADGDRLARSALCRLLPWDSATLIDLKLCLAAYEAGEADLAEQGKNAKATMAARRAFLDLHHALSSGGYAAPSLGALSSSITASQLRLLSPHHVMATNGGSGAAEDSASVWRQKLPELPAPGPGRP